MPRDGFEEADGKSGHEKSIFSKAGPGPKQDPPSLSGIHSLFLHRGTEALDWNLPQTFGEK